MTDVDSSRKPFAASSRITGRPWALVVLGLLVLLPGNQVIPLIDRDEPRFAQATREMMERHEWLIPYFNGDYRFDKPVLTYWLMRGGYALFGVNEFGARLHSVLAAVALALVLCTLGRRWLSPAAGWLAGVASLTCVQTMIHGRAAVADLPMVLCVTVAMGALWELIGTDEPRAGRAAFWLLWVSLGLGFLAKGPIALAVPLLALLLLRFAFLRRPLPWRRLRVAAGFPVMLLIIGAWGIPALLATHGDFWRVGIGEHIVERGTKAFNKRMFLPIYYPVTALVSLFPWSLLLVPVWRAWRRVRSPLHAFLMSWFAAPFIIFTFYATQLPHYILPAFPAFFLMIGQVGDAVKRRRTALIALVVILCIALQGAGFWLRRHTPAVQLQALFRDMPAETVYACYRFREPSLVFYSGRRWQILSRIEDVQAFVDEPGPRLLVMEERNKSKDYCVEVDGVHAAGYAVTKVAGFDIARTTPVDLRVFFRR